MEAMFQNVNRGLNCRFPPSSAFEFEDFDDAALLQILDLKFRKSGLTATSEVKKVVIEVLNKARNRPSFGNAGETDILLGRAQASYQKRQSKDGVKGNVREAVDFDADFDRA